LLAIERAIATFAQLQNGGIIVAASGIGATNINLIITAVDLIDAVVGLPRWCWGLSSVTLDGNLQGTEHEPICCELSCIRSRGALADFAERGAAYPRLTDYYSE
jgi:hypothetical protein